MTRAWTGSSPTVAPGATVSDMAGEPVEGLKLIRAWFGDEVVQHFTVAEVDAKHRAHLLQQRFSGLKITTDDACDVDDYHTPSSGQVLPERRWRGVPPPRLMI